MLNTWDSINTWAASCINGIYLAFPLLPCIPRRSGVDFSKHALELFLRPFWLQEKSTKALLRRNLASILSTSTDIGKPEIFEIYSVFLLFPAFAAISLNWNTHGRELFEDCLRWEVYQSLRETAPSSCRLFTPLSYSVGVKLC